MIEDIGFYDDRGNLFTASAYEDALVVCLYTDDPQQMSLTKDQALRLSEYIKEVFSE